MPQLMPLFWNLSVFMFVFIFLLMIDMYFYKNMEIDLIDMKSMKTEEYLFMYLW